MESIETLSEKLSLLSSVVSKMGEINSLRIRSDNSNDASFMALLSIVKELAQKQGVSTENFLKHFDCRRRWWIQHKLHLMENFSPELAARIDDRTLSEVDTLEDYPSIFDSPPPNLPE